MAYRQDNQFAVESTKHNNLTHIYRYRPFSFLTNTFDSIESATRVRENLNGCDIYSGCCTLKIDYAKVSQ